MNNEAQEFLKQIKIATPCTASWDKMKGTDQVRDCGQCQKKVYNLSLVSAQEAMDLIKEKEGDLCVKFYRRFDGTLITSDCPIGIRARARWLWLRVATLIAALLGSLYWAGHNSKYNPFGRRRPYICTGEEMGGARLPQAITGNVMGDVDYPSDELQGKVIRPR